MSKCESAIRASAEPHVIWACIVKFMDAANWASHLDPEKEAKETSIIVRDAFDVVWC